MTGIPFSAFSLSNRQRRCQHCQGRPTYRDCPCHRRWMIALHWCNRAFWLGDLFLRLSPVFFLFGFVPHSCSSCECPWQESACWCPTFFPIIVVTDPNTAVRYMMSFLLKARVVFARPPQMFLTFTLDSAAEILRKTWWPGSLDTIGDKSVVGALNERDAAVQLSADTKRSNIIPQQGVLYLLLWKHSNFCLRNDFLAFLFKNV